MIKYNSIPAYLITSEKSLDEIRTFWDRIPKERNARTVRRCLVESEVLGRDERAYKDKSINNKDSKCYKTKYSTMQADDV